MSLRHVRDLNLVYADQLRDGVLPSLVQFLALPSQSGMMPSKLPRRVYDDLYSSVRNYYATEVARSILSQRDDICRKGRREDTRWCTRMRYSYLWYFQLPVAYRIGYGYEGMPVSRPEILGSTNREDIREMRERYTLLSAIKPSQRYEVVEEDTNVYVYDGAVTLDVDEWDKELVDRLVYQGHVVGPFAYATREDAEAYQEARL